MASTGEHTVSLLARLPTEAAEEYTTDGSLDFDGNPALKNRTGTEFCYCLAFHGISFNLVTYLTGVLGQSNVAAARNVSTWQATCFLMPLGGAVVADSYCGRYRTMVVSCFIGVAVRHADDSSLSVPAAARQGQRVVQRLHLVQQEFVLFLGLYMIAVGLGGLRPCLMSFGADQFDDGDPSERATKGSFFNWYIFNVNCASLISSTGIVWVQDHYDWALGLTIPAVVLAAGLSCRVEQGMAMDATVGSVRVPPASMSTFDILTIILLVPLYDRAFVPAARRLTGREKGISELQRIGAGLAMPVLAMAAAALLETARLRAAPNSTSVLWQAPQYALVGVGEVLTTIGQLDFFYGQAPAAMKTVCTALALLAVAAGGYLSSFLLTAVQWATATGGAPGWIPDDLNEGHLDRFFWMMAGLGCLNLLAFGSCARRYKWELLVGAASAGYR
uniref:Peptide transporter PTR2 n=1 Tax=Aegilops tauschii TaxID=37682 RepID=R7W5G8_AEGTA